MCETLGSHEPLKMEAPISSETCQSTRFRVAEEESFSHDTDSRWNVTIWSSLFPSWSPFPFWRQTSGLTLPSPSLAVESVLDCVWNVMAHAQKPDFVFRRNGLVHLNRRGRQFSRLLAAELCASAVVMLGTPCSEVVWRVLATHSIRQFFLHFPSRESPCAITFQLDSTTATVYHPSRTCH